MTDEILKKGERTRQIIMDSAYGLIIEQGYAATSMRQIAEKAGLALGSIYNHFSSKEDVFSDIVQERHPFFQILPVLNSVAGEYGGGICSQCSANINRPAWSSSRFFKFDAD